MIKTNPYNVSQIKKVADELRKSYNVPSDTFFPIYDYIMALCDADYLEYQILDDDNKFFAEGEYAKYCGVDNTIYVKDSVDAEVTEQSVIGYRSNFTLAHELFHFIQVQVLKFNFENVDEKPQAFCDPEWQANEFAGQLLVPEKYLNLEEEEIMNRFHVSQECALYRKLKYKTRNKGKNNG